MTQTTAQVEPDIDAERYKAWQYLLAFTHDGAFKLTDRDVEHDPYSSSGPMWENLPLRRLANLFKDDRSVNHNLIVRYRLGGKSLTTAQRRATLNILLAYWKNGYRAVWMKEPS